MSEENKTVGVYESSSSKAEVWEKVWLGSPFFLRLRISSNVKWIVTVERFQGDFRKRARSLEGRVEGPQERQTKFERQVHIQRLRNTQQHKERTSGQEWGARPENLCRPQEEIERHKDRVRTFFFFCLQSTHFSHRVTSERLSLLCLHKK